MRKIHLTEEIGFFICANTYATYSIANILLSFSKCCRILLFLSLYFPYFFFIFLLIIFIIGESIFILPRQGYREKVSPPMYHILNQIHQLVFLTPTGVEKKVAASSYFNFSLISF